MTFNSNVAGARLFGPWLGAFGIGVLLASPATAMQPASPAPPGDVDAPASAVPAPSPDDPSSAPSASPPSASAPSALAAPSEDAPPADPSPTVEPAAAPRASDRPVEVTVAGAPIARTAGSAHVLKSRQLERFEYDDPHAVLVTVPGVYVRGEDGVGLRPNIGVRGVNPDRSKKITLTEDGVLFGPAPYSAPAAYYFPLITRMSSVRVIKGPAAIAYGPQTVGGAIDLVTRPIPSSTSGAVDLAYGEYGYNKLHGHVGSSDEKSGFLIEGLHLGSDGFKHLPNGADTGFVRNEWMFKGFYVPVPTARVKNEIRLKLTYSDEISNETYLGLSDADFRADPLRRYPASKLDRMVNHRTAIAVSHDFEPSKNFSITTTAYRNDFARVWRKANRLGGAGLFDVLRDPSGRNAVFRAVLAGEEETTLSQTASRLFVGPNDRTFVSQGVETRARWDTSTGPVSHHVEYGLRLHYDRIERRHSENGFLVVNGDLVPDGGPTQVTAFNEASTQALALHATDAIRWGGLTLTPGFRVEALRSTFIDRAAKTERTRALQVFLPGAGAFYGITRDFGLLAGVHKGFSPPEPGSASSTKSESSVNYEGGARFSSRRVRAELIGYYNDYSNITDVCTQSSGCVEANLDRQFDGGKARIYGFEAFAEAEIPVVEDWKIPFTAAYTFTKAHFLSDFTSEDPIFGVVHANDEIPYVPRHQLAVSAGFEGRRAGLMAGVTYVSRMREEPGSGPISEALATDEQLLVDVSGNLRVFGPVVLYANVRNLFNEHYIVGRRPYGARPNAPRWMQAGVKVAF